VNLLLDAFAWIVSSERYHGSGSLPVRVAEHLTYSIIGFVFACAIAIPLGYLIGHTGKGRQFAIALSGAVRALPSFGLILFLVLVIGVLQVRLAVVLALVVLAVPSVLAGAYAGLEAIERGTIDAARAVGMTEWQILLRVEIPLGLSLLVGGMRNGMLQIVATATLASYVGLGGLGYDILQGIALRRYDQTLGGAIVVVALALALDGVFAILQRFAERAGAPKDRRRRMPTASLPVRAVAGPGGA